MPGIYPSVRALVMDRGRFLALRQEREGSFSWDLPGGRIGYGEAPMDALHREVKEQVGLDISVERPLGIWWYFKSDRDQVVCFTFICRAKGRRVRLGEDPAQRERIAEALWVSKEDFLSERFRVEHGSLKNLVSGI